MSQTFFHEKFNTSIVTALLFSNLPISEKERKLQKFVNENEERYDIFCDNINRLLVNKGLNSTPDTLYLTIDGFSFISNSIIEHQASCVPILTINQYSPNCPDISAYVDIALSYFSSYSNLVKSVAVSFDQSA